MRRSRVLRVLVLAFVLGGLSPQVHPAASGAGEILEKEVPIQITEVAPGLYFQYHHQESNNAFLVTDDGVLVIDTRQHPKRAEELVATIRKYTDKPIRWVVNTHAHGDHYFGNSVFKREGAVIITHRDTAGMMKAQFDREMTRRMGYFKQRKYDPAEVTLVLPDVTFDSRITLTLGGRTVELFYLGPGQNPGDTFIHFPKERVLYAGGPFSKQSWPNPSFTPSMQSWIEVLKKIAAMDVDKYLGGHGDVGTKQDVLDEARMLADFDAGMRAAVAKGMTREEIIKNLRFEQYKDVRNHYRMNLFISSYYHYLTTGKAENAYP
jgi:glyoxylase-like metal-dependent hydrolase (beta-lactamase superfamily II)